MASREPGPDGSEHLLMSYCPYFSAVDEVLLGNFADRKNHREERRKGEGR
jgi:hypothetical protein